MIGARGWRTGKDQYQTPDRKYVGEEFRHVRIVLEGEEG